jgi:transposase
MGKSFGIYLLIRDLRSYQQLFSYLGFTPVEYSSGQHVRQGHMSRQGRSLLRHIFIESAWVAIQKDPKLKKIYQRIADTRGGKRAIVGVARRLAGYLRTCVQLGAFYEFNHEKHKATPKQSLETRVRSFFIRS